MTADPAVPFEAADVYNDEGYYAVIPEWVLDAEISAQAVRLYAVLRRYADQRSMFATPSRRTLADRLRVKDEKVVDRAVADLERIGALTVVARYRDEAGRVAYAPDGTHRERTSNGYRLHRTPHTLVKGGGGGENAPTPRRESPHGGGAEAPTVGAQKGEEPQPCEPQPCEPQPCEPQPCEPQKKTPEASHVGNARKRAIAPGVPQHLAELDPQPVVDTGPPAELGGDGHQQWKETREQFARRPRRAG